jgi:hypothetical protein
LRVLGIATSVAVVLMASAGNIGPRVNASDPVDAPPSTEAMRRQGLHYAGLMSADSAHCPGMPYQLQVTPGLVACTHGPDPAPEGVDVRKSPSLGELASRVRQAGAAVEAAVTAPASLAGTSGTVPCVGDGGSGKRLVAIYAHQASVPSRYGEVAPMIQSWAGAADGIVDASAATTGGSRHLRWEHDDACHPLVREVALTASAISSFDQMIAELYAAGFNRYDRRYVVWVDVDNHYCGIAMTYIDERPGQDNVMNGVASAGLGLMARIDLPCWGLPAPYTLVEAHEITHTLGAVQPHAPHSSSVIAPDGSVAVVYGHCTDEYDLMCYADGSPKSLTYPCSQAYDRLLDCRHDDYFHTKPSSGTYLALHWNTAMSSFLVRVDPIAGFLDIGSSAFRADIAWLSATGITRGCTADRERFCPGAEVSRGQMAAFLARALSLPATSVDHFTDDNGTQFEGDINRLAAAGITRGCTTTTFCPDGLVARQQMASFLARALHLPTTSSDFFTDDEGSIHEGDINRLAASRITSGCSPTTFCPQLIVTREQMAAFLHRGLS